MDKLTFPNGGLPLYGNDFDYMQTALRDGISAALRPFAELNAGNMVVSGCVLSFNNTTGTYHVSAGWVMIEYEVLYFPGGDSGVSDPSDLADIEVERWVYEDPAPQATRTMANGSSANVWQKRVARYRQTVGVTYLKVAVQETKLAYLAAKLIEGAADFELTITGFVNGWAADNLYTPKQIRRGNTVILRGLFNVGTMSNSSFTPIFTLPSTHRPKVKQYFICPLLNDGIAYAEVNTNGVFSAKIIIQSVGFPPEKLDISGIRFEGS